jgi:hypothetical protein
VDYPTTLLKNLTNNKLFWWLLHKNREELPPRNRAKLGAQKRSFSNSLMSSLLIKIGVVFPTKWVLLWGTFLENNKEVVFP